MKFLRLLFSYDALADVMAIARDQNALIKDLREESLRQRLIYARSTRDLIQQFRVVLETPEVDVREALEAAYADLSDEVARLEERVV